MGMMHALWLLRPAHAAAALSTAMAEVAAPLTTSLSAAWLRAAARGEASAAWHGLVNAVIDPEARSMHAAVRRILDTGHTSGADALAGLRAVLNMHSQRLEPCYNPAPMGEAWTNVTN